ncbi:YSIRK-type signal peptide-containing protein [Lactobacillus delbrueckii]|uniref:YSIRK-type signal peptide-containing protein n=1 Tax=Lactobacillus delbrueckii TaxID=1584 RepID=UPI0012F8EC50|nr:YSIRK-type signal peptide-containing protein [Lactobacillus delbrueckii]
MEEKTPYTYKREKQRFSIRKTKAWGACSVFLGTSILFLSAGTVARADTTADASTSAQVVKQKTTVNTESTDSAEATTPNQNKSTATNTENSASETQSSSQNSAEESTSSSSTAKAETTNASSSSTAKAETTSASNSSAVKAETTSVSNSSAVKAETTNASSSSAVKAETASASNSSAANAETTSASSSSAANAETASASNSSAVEADAISAGGNQIVAQIATNVSKNDAIVSTKFAQNYGRWVLAGSVTNKGFSVSDPDYPSGMWIDPDKSHYSYEWLQTKNYGNQIVLSTNRTGDGIVYVTELSPSNKVLKQYTLNQNTKVPSAVFDSTTYYNDTYYAMVESLRDPLAVKYIASKYDTGYYNRLSYMVPKLITQTTYYVDKDGKQITDSNGNPVVPYTQKGLVGQNYTTSDVTVVNGYYAIAPANSNGVMSPYGEIGASYVKDFHNGIVITYTQTGSDGTMSASIAQNGKVLKTWTNIKPSDPAIMYQVGSTTSAIKNPYIPQTSDVEYVYSKLGNWVVSNPDGSTKSIIYPNDPSVVS